jgi:hypothetical protein
MLSRQSGSVGTTILASSPSPPPPRASQIEECGTWCMNSTWLSSGQVQLGFGHHKSVLRLLCYWQNILPAGRYWTARPCQQLSECVTPPSTRPQSLLHHFNSCRTLRFAASSKSAAASSVSLTQHSCSITAGLKVNVLQPCMQDDNQHT